MNLNEKIQLLQNDYSEEMFEEVYNEVADTMLYNARKYKIVGQDVDDSFSILAMELPKAIQKFDTKKNIQFKTYFNTVCRNRLINEQIAQKNILNEVRDTDISEMYDLMECNNIDFDDIALRIDILNANISDEAKLILDRLVFENARKIDIANELGISKSRLSQKIKELVPEIQNLVLA